MGNEESKARPTHSVDEYERTLSQMQLRNTSVTTDKETNNASKAKSSYKVVAAIDFGTTFSGFAYSFSDDINEIITGKHGNILKSDRVPTVVLLNQDGRLISFGYDAEDNYSNAQLEETHQRYRLFERFKMSLYSSERLHGEMTIDDTDGHPMTAVDLFSIVIGHLKQLIIRSIIDTTAGDTEKIEDNIYWMLTIPAIWSDSARQFMRLAAKNAGIPKNRLRLVLEPEAAAVFCKSEILHLDQCVGLTKLPAGTKYILADLGGGTADICVHEVLDHGRVRELYRSTGGAFGGESVNKGYVEFLKDLFGSTIWENFTKRKFDYIRVMRDFETIKNKFDYEHPESVVIDLPESLIVMLGDNDLRKAAEKLRNSSLIVVRRNKLVCKRKLIEQFFKPSIFDGIIPILHEIKTQCRNDNITTLLVVGGYAESTYLRQIIKKEIQDVKVVLSKQPQLSVLKGAVMMGFEPEDVIERRSRFTYGFMVAVPFVEGIHPECLKFEREGEFLCNNIFNKLFEKDTFLKYGQMFIVTTKNIFKQKTSRSRHESMIVALYRSGKCNPKYCMMSDDCEEIGKFVIEPPTGGWSNTVQFNNVLIVGETEFTVRAFDKSTGREFKAFVDFL